MEPKLYFDDGCMLSVLLSAGAVSKPKKFRKMNIHDLMDSQRRNEEIKETHEKAKRWFLPLSVLFLVVFGVFLFCFKAWDTGVVIAFLIGLVLTIYLFTQALRRGSPVMSEKRELLFTVGMRCFCSGSFLLRSGHCGLPWEH